MSEQKKFPYGKQIVFQLKINGWKFFCFMQNKCIPTKNLEMILCLNEETVLNLYLFLLENVVHCYYYLR